MLYDLLYRAFDIVRWVGLPLAILAWITVAGSSIAMAIVLRRTRRPGIWAPSFVVGIMTAAAFAADIGVTLWVSPDLALEANPIWRAVVDAWGMTAANVYALSGKVLVLVLCVQFFAWYLATRDRLEPTDDRGFLRFALTLGSAWPRRLGIRWPLLLSLGAFLFATIGPYFLYVAFLNAIVLEPGLRDRFPSPPAVIALYLAGTTALYFAVGYRAFRRRRSAAPFAA